MYRPSGDVSGYSKCSSGSDKYALINDTFADDDATYIYDGASDTQPYNIADVFYAWPEKAINAKVRITNVRLFYRIRVTNAGKNDIHDSYISFVLTVGGSAYRFTTWSKDSPHTYSCTSTTYVNVERTLTATQDSIGLDAIPEFNPADATAQIEFRGSYQKGSSKNDDFQQRVTQIYAELTYEEVSEPETSTGLYLKQSGAYSQINAVWKKENGLWVKADKTAIDAGKNYRIVQR